MTDLPIAQTLHRQGAEPTDETCRLDYAARFLRRKRLTTEAGRPFVVDLPQTTSLDDGDALELTDGTRIAIRAAEEAVLEVRGDSLAGLAYRQPAHALPDCGGSPADPERPRDPAHAGASGRRDHRGAGAVHARRRGLWPWPDPQP